MQQRLKKFSIKKTIEYNCFTCIVVGSLTNRKGQSRLLYAMGRLCQEGYRFHLYFVGEGSEENL